MHQLTYSLGASLDGYVIGPDGRFDWSAPDEEVFALATDEVRGLRAHLLGRSLYETMLYWEDVEPESELEAEFAALWNGLEKVVFSSTLSEVRGTSTRLATGTVAEEVAALRELPGDGDIAIGGPTLAAVAHQAGLIDEYRLRLFPVAVGGGTPYLPVGGERVDLELVEARPVGRGGVVYVRYRRRQ